jgi:hypothetical protein
MAVASTPARKPAYLRGVPAGVVREAKAAAAKRGVTLAGFVTDSLARALRDQLSIPDPAHDLSQEMRWYERNRERLVREFDGEYIAVLDNAVIDHDFDFEALAERVFAQHGCRDLFMPRVSKTNVAVRLRSPRVQRAR